MGGRQRGRQQQKVVGKPANPGFSQALQDHKAGRLDRAEQGYRAVLAREPGHFHACNNLAVVLKTLGRHAEAETVYRRAIEIDGRQPECHFNLAILLDQMGRSREAEALYRRAVELRDTYVEALSNLGALLMKLRRDEESVELLERALGLSPNHIEARFNLACSLNEIGESERAIEILDGLLELQPRYMQAHLLRAIARIPKIYRDQQHLSDSRARYARALAELEAAVRLDSAEEIAAASAMVGKHQPFFLAYQGQPAPELQQAYGGLMCRIMAAAYPHYAEPPPMPPLEAGKPIRVGLLSGYFRLHSNWKIPIKGWIENLDKGRFQLFGYYTDTPRDEHTAEAERICHKFVQGPKSVADWARTIREDDLHMLIVPEIGMDHLTAAIAALRLAPVQATSWGHPMTSGYPTLDYYLSSDLMEPEGAEAQYSEKLVRLPNLSIHYTPIRLPEAPVTRARMKVEEDAVVYWCCQNLAKYLPEYDDIFPRIAARVPKARFVFVQYRTGGGRVNRVFRERLAEAFARHGLDAGEHCRFLPQMDAPTFAAASRQADIFLDSIGWSGCNSTIEAIASHMPVVTLPGATMRANHSAAILRMMGLGDTICGSLDEYLEMAVQLGLDPNRRRALSARVAEGEPRIYTDMACVRGLERFILESVGAEMPIPAEPASPAQAALAPLFAALRPARVMTVGSPPGWSEAAAALGATTLRPPLPPGQTVDLALCLGALDGVAAETLPGVLDSLAGLAGAVLFASTGSQRERDLPWWTAEFARRGLQPVDAFRARLWTEASHPAWLRQSIVLFAAPATSARLGHGWEPGPRFPLDAAHPEMVAPLAAAMDRLRVLAREGGQFRLGLDGAGNLTVARS